MGKEEGKGRGREGGGDGPLRQGGQEDITTVLWGFLGIFHDVGVAWKKCLCTLMGGGSG